MGKSKKRCFILVIILTLLSTGFTGASAKEKQKPSGPAADLVILQNVPEAAAEIKDHKIKLNALNVYNDGHFKKNNEVKWISASKKIASVTSDGTVKLTGKPGTAIITASNGKRFDTAFIKVDRRGEASFKKMKWKRYDLVSNSIKKMSIEEKIGQMLMPDYRNWNGENVTEMLPEIEKQVKDLHLGGVILFRENVVTTEQTARLVADYQQAAEKYDLFMTIDQEGGIVTRLQSGTDMPGNMALGAARSPELAESVGQAIGEELNALGINVNFAPSLDVNNNSENPVIGVRSISENPQLVAEIGMAYIKGLQGAGVSATAKHFPGHGDTAVDSHVGLPEVPHDMERLKEIELYPFQQAMDEGVDAIMTAHITFPKIDPTKAISKKTGEEVSLPATLSHEILTNLIRKEMKYKGVVVTDALNMGAIQDHFGAEEAAVKAVKAGTDILLMPVGVAEVRNALLKAVRDGEISEKRIEASVERLLALKIKRGIIKEENPMPVEKKIAKAMEIVGSSAHKQVEQEAADRSITLIKNEDVLPLRDLDPENKIVVVGTTYVNDLGTAIKEKHPNTDTIVLSANPVLTAEQRQLLDEASYIIIGSTTSNVAGRDPANPVMTMYRSIISEYDTPVISVGIRNPYDIMAYPETDAYLAQYGFRTASFRSTAAVIMGELSPTGKLPVTIPGEAGSQPMYPYGHGLMY